MIPGEVTRCAVRAGSYHDSIVLMQLQQALATLPGVLDAGVVMATPANLEVLASGGLEVDVKAGPDDLLVAVRAESEEAAAEALSRVDALLRVRGAAETGEYRPRSLATALKQLPEARWVLVSVPGRYAADVAQDALDHDRNVFLYSDNVPLDREAALKRQAREKGLLVMGPDCGTAWLGGVGLGFANRVRRGEIGLIGASGTGLQAVMSHIHELGSGISQAIGTGGRDLAGEVGGITALQALGLLGRDPETAVLVLISKPPSPEVAHRLLSAARELGKPVVVQFLGAPLPGHQIGNLYFAASLSGAAEMAVALEKGYGFTKTGSPAGGGFLRGLFSGGTLAYEALLGLSAMLAPIYSNLSSSSEARGGHAILDLGADEFTVGRLHPMIDQDLRLRRLRQEAADPEVSVILLDVVLGYGAHADPAGELAPVIVQIQQSRSLAIAVIVIGTAEDPQDLAVQMETLEAAGARVFRTVTEAVEWVSSILTPAAKPEGKAVPLETIRGPLAAVNIGLESFHASLLAQDAAAIQVDWRPPAGGDERLAGILARMKR